MKQLLMLLMLLVFTIIYAVSVDAGPPQYEKIGLYEVPQVQASVQILETFVHADHNLYKRPEKGYIYGPYMAFWGKEVYKLVIFGTINDYPLLCYSKSNIRLRTLKQNNRLIPMDYSQLGYSIRS